MQSCAICCYMPFKFAVECFLPSACNQAEVWLQEVNDDVPDRPASYWIHCLEMEDNAHAKCNFAGKAVKHFAMMLGPSRRSERLEITAYLICVLSHA